MKRAIVAAVVVVLYTLGSMGCAQAATGIATPPQPSPASTPTTYTTLQATELATDFSHIVVVRSSATLMTAGTSYPLTGTWTGTSPIGSLMGLRMRCQAPGVPYVYSVWSTTNHLGVEHGDAGENNVYGRWLFTPRVTAEYECELVGQAGRVNNPDEHMTVTSAALTVYPAKVGGSEWRHLSEDLRVNSAAGSRTTWTLRKTYTAPAGTTSVRVYTGTEVSCYSTGNHNPFVGKVTTYVDQIDSAGRVIKSWTDAKTREIAGKLHHDKFHHSLTVTPNPAYPPTFRISVRLRWLAYDGIDDRHGGMVNGPVNVGPYTSAHAYPLAGT